MSVLRERDTTDLFARADRGEIEHVAGINAPYEEPTDADVVLDTDRLTPEAARDRVLAALEQRGYVEPVTSASYTADEEEMIRKRLQDLGYL